MKKICYLFIILFVNLSIYSQIDLSDLDKHLLEEHSFTLNVGISNLNILPYNTSKYQIINFTLCRVDYYSGAIYCAEGGKITNCELPDNYTLSLDLNSKTFPEHVEKFELICNILEPSQENISQFIYVDIFSCNKEILGTFNLNGDDNVNYLIKHPSNINCNGYSLSIFTVNEGDKLESANGICEENEFILAVPELYLLHFYNPHYVWKREKTFFDKYYLHIM